MRLLMLPGLDGTGKLFRPLLQALPSQLKSQVIPYPADRVLSYDALVHVVQRAFPRGEPFVLLGESFGGPLCLKCVFPPVENLRAVILSATFVTSPFPTGFSWIPWTPQPLAAWMLRCKPPDALVRFYAAGMDSSQDLVELFQEAKMMTRPGVLAGRLQAIQEVDVRTALEHCRVPVLCLRASKDRLIARACHQQMLSARPDMKVVEIDSPHFLLQRRPHEAAKAIVEFVNSLS